jgi:adenine specific DNA methylase Mod
MEKDNNSIPTGLYWQGKRTEVERISLPFQTIETINESRATREKDKEVPLLRSSRGADTEHGNWYNRLIWGDNKYVMSSLLDEFAGKIDLIYIDPPFATGADFSVEIEVGDVEWTKEASAIEEKAYRDTWGKGLDSYLQMMYDRLVLMRDLLSDKGSIYLHLDWHLGHYIKILMDEIIGKDNFLNEIIWAYFAFKRSTAKKFPQKHDIILSYHKSENYTWKTQYKPHKEEYLKRWKKDENGRYYRDDVNPTRGGTRTIYLDELKGDIVDSVWDDIPPVNPVAVERENFPTQKPESLIERIMKASSDKGDLVADFFCGSGTTAAVAEKLGRRWLMCDIGRYAIHVTRKRLLGIEGCKPFVVQNLGKYERQYWQGVTFTNRTDDQKPIYEYIKFILDLYHAEPITGCLWIHGKKGKNLIHVGAVDAPVTLSDIESAIDECKKMKQSSLDILGWEWEMGLHDVIQELAKTKGVNLSLKYIPREVMDPRAVAAGDITFYELAYLEIDVAKNKHGEFVVTLKDFVIPNHDLIPDEVRSKIKKWSDYIDYWSIDWDFNNDTFHNMWQSYRTRKDRALELKSDPHLYEKKGKHPILIKVIDIFGNDTTRIVEVIT